MLTPDNKKGCECFSVPAYGLLLPFNFHELQYCFPNGSKVLSIFGCSPFNKMFCVDIQILKMFGLWVVTSQSKGRTVSPLVHVDAACAFQ